MPYLARKTKQSFCAVTLSTEKEYFSIRVGTVRGFMRISRSPKFIKVRAALAQAFNRMSAIIVARVLMQMSICPLLKDSTTSLWTLCAYMRLPAAWRLLAEFAWFEVSLCLWGTKMGKEKKEIFKPCKRADVLLGSFGKSRWMEDEGQSRRQTL